jgi:hypothetical protein
MLSLRLRGFAAEIDGMAAAVQVDGKLSDEDTTFFELLRKTTDSMEALSKLCEHIQDRPKEFGAHPAALGILLGDSKIISLSLGCYLTFAWPYFMMHCSETLP